MQYAVAVTVIIIIELVGAILAFVFTEEVVSIETEHPADVIKTEIFFPLE